MADVLRHSVGEKDTDQAAIAALKKGAYLLKYGRIGKPKFCPFRLSPDETALIWYYGKDEKQLDLRQVVKIIPGQRTAIFHRYPRPEKEYQSFSLIYGDRSLDLICKDKDEAEVWFAGLKTLIARFSNRKAKSEVKEHSFSSESPKGQKNSSSILTRDRGDSPRAEGFSRSKLGLAFAEIGTITATPKNPSPTETQAVLVNSPFPGATENPTTRTSNGDRVRVSLSSAVSSSSQGSCPEDPDGSGDVFIFGEGTGGGGVLVGSELRSGESSSSKFNANIPKVVESTMVLDVRSVACGEKYAILVTKQGDVFSWGEESGGRLGHGVEFEVSHPKLIDNLNTKDVQMVSCGKFHSCAVTYSGDLYTWGDGTHYCGLLGHGNEVGHCIPKKVCGVMDDLQVSYVSCGPWHTALITSNGQLFTFGDGSFGALGHGDHSSTSIPREVEALKGNQTVRVDCGVWHSAAVVEVTNEGSLSGNLFTWGNGSKGKLGHGDTEPRLIPERVALPAAVSFSKVACGHHFTVALTIGGKVYTMGSTPVCVEGNIADSVVEEIACGSHHIALLTSTSEVYTWGKGSNGQLGHGDNDDRNTPTLVDFFKNKQVKSVACGSNSTVVLCNHKWISGAHNSICAGCQSPFNFMKQRHNCYNCGLVFCNTCSSKKSLKASLAPSTNKPYRVCDDCFTKLQKSLDTGSAPRFPKVKSENLLYKFSDPTGKEIEDPQMPGNVSRLMSLDSFNHAEGKTSRSSANSNDGHGHMFLIQNGNVRRSSVSSCKSTIDPAKPYWKLLSCSLPDSKKVSWPIYPVSRSTSPLPRRSLSKEGPSFPGNRDSREDEIKALKAKVEELANKTQLLEEELAHKSTQLKETALRATDEAEKAKTATEVIKSLTTQLKEIVERVPESHITSSTPTTSNTERTSTDSNHLSSSSSVTTPVLSPRSEPSHGKVSMMVSNGTKVKTEKSEWVIKDKPGVYLTLSSSPNGGNELKKVRFSRKRFTEERASKWWTENVTELYQKYNIRTVI